MEMGLLTLPKSVRPVMAVVLVELWALCREKGCGIM